MANKKVACIVYYTDSRYDELASNVRNSFMKFHEEEADYYQIDYKNREEWNNKLKYFEFGNEVGLMWLIYAYEIMLDKQYEKIIILGSDTIVCSRLDEFMDDNTTPVLASLNYYIHEETEHWSTPMQEISLPDGSTYIEHFNLNSDVLCFNSAEALRRVIDITMEHYTIYTIQGGLNELYSRDKSFEVKIVDAPYELSKVSYNVRSKGVPRAEMIYEGKLQNCWPRNIHGFPYEWLAKRDLIDGKISPIHKWYVKDSKLYTHDHKQIKCFHFVEAIGAQPLQKFHKLVNDFKTNWFNRETLEYFRNMCNCGEFFNQIV